MKPRVLFLGAVPPPYMGPTLATEVILNSSLRERFELIHLDTSDHREIDTLGAFDFLNFYLALKFYCVLLWKIICHRPALVYIPISQTTIGYLKDSIYILASKLLGRRVICHLRGGNFKNWLSGASGATRLYVRLVHGLVNGQIVLGETLRDLFAGILPPERLYVVPNGKDIAYPEKPAADGTVRVVYLANMIRTKGVLDALHAVPAAAARCPRAQFLFAGAWEDPVLRLEIEGFLAANPGLPVRWVGPTRGREKSDLLNGADIFVFPTYYPPEGHPWVIVEAMAAGLPIVSTDQGAIVESVIHERNGFIVAKQDPEAVAGRLIQLIEDPQLRKRMGEESRRLYLAEFTEARMVARLGDALAAVISGGS